MGQNWWWVVLVILVVVALLAVAALRVRGRRAATTSPSDVEIAAAAAGGAAGAVGAGAVVATHTHEPPAGTADAATAAGPGDEPGPRDEEARATPGSRPVEDESAAGAGPAEVNPPEAVHPPTGRAREPADSALAALDSGLVGRASTFGAAAAAVSAAVTRPGPHPGSVLPAADGDAPSPDYPVKANEGSRRYHTPDSPYYVRTRGDVWFRTAQDAHAAGFTAWDARR